MNGERIAHLYGGQVSLVYRDSDHKYFISTGGSLVEVPSATTILSKFFPFSNPDYTAKQVANFVQDNFNPNIHDAKYFAEVTELAKKAPDKALRQSAKRGNVVHQFIQEYIDSEINSTPKPDFPKYEADLCKRWVGWNSLCGIRWIASEKLVYSVKSGCAGTLDAIGIKTFGKKPPRVVIYDWKTSLRPSLRYDLQTAIYAAAYEEEIEATFDESRPDLMVSERHTLHIHPSLHKPFDQMYKDQGQAQLVRDLIRDYKRIVPLERQFSGKGHHG